MAERILVIDDDPGTLSTYRTILRLDGYDVATASTGRDALALLNSGDFGLVLADLRLGDMSGLDVLAEASTARPNVPVVMTSAWGTEASVLASKQLGAVEFFHKSLEPGDLVGAVRRNVRPARHQEAIGGASFVNHAATRWATLIVPVTQFTADPSTIAAWSAGIGKAATTVKTWCAAAGVPAGDSLDFAPLLRVVLRWGGQPCDWHAVLAVVDPRTLNGLLKRGGLLGSDRMPALDAFLRNQQLISDAALLASVRSLLNRLQ